MGQGADAQQTTGGAGSKQIALTTYRLLRFAILGAVLLLAVSVGREVTQADCWQEQLSTYYHTPVRSIFVGGLMATGLCLIVIQGRTYVEDILLNIGGMLAPVVALVPTRVVPTDCPATWENDVDPLALIDPSVSNNMFTLIWTGIAIGAAGILVALLAPSGAKPSTVFGRVGIAFLVTLAVVIVASLLYYQWDWLHDEAHWVAAVGMFIFFGLVAVLNAGYCWVERLYVFTVIYGGIAIAMLVVAIVLGLSSADHRVLVLEIIEIGLFATFWAVQTFEQWSKIDAPTKALPTRP
jgi:hypothetical protein